MATETYPATLPQDALAAGYRRAMADNVLRSPMEGGPAKTRRRFTSVPKTFACQVIMTAAQLAIFKTWHEEDILDGALRFNWTDQDDGTTAVEMRFLSAPEWSSIKGRDEWVVNMALEIMP